MYNFDDAFHRAVKAYTKHQKLLDFWILSTKMSKKIIENGPQCFIPRELVIFEFFLFELVRYSADGNVSSDWTKMILLLLLLDNYWHYWEFISHNFVDKRQNIRNFLKICLSFCSMKCRGGLSLFFSAWAEPSQNIFEPNEPRAFKFLLQAFLGQKILYSSLLQA